MLMELLIIQILFDIVIMLAVLVVTGILETLQLDFTEGYMMDFGITVATLQLQLVFIIIIEADQ